MKLQKLTVKHFRCLKLVENLTFDNLTVFVGRNGSGKSTILRAISVLFQPNASISIEDFFKRAIDKPIIIQATFSDFSFEEQKEFRAYIQKGKMIVTKRISWKLEDEAPQEEYFSYTTQIPEFAEIREREGAREKTNAFKELLSKGTFADLTGQPRSAADVLEIMEKYEESHPSLTKLTEAKLHFFGATNVGGGKLDKYTRFVHLPAVKEATEEIEGKNSAIEQLLNLLVLKEMETRSDLVEFREKMTRRIMRKFSPENLGGLDDISRRLSARLGLYSPGSSLALHWDEIEPPNFDLPTVNCGVSEDGFEGIVQNKGHGLQRALVLTLLEHLSNISALEEIGEESGTKQLRIDTILAIEEPEIYLHPSRARYFSSLLRKLTGVGKKSSSQIFYTTHSPYFVGMDRFNDIRVCRKKARAKGVADTFVSFYDLESANKLLENVCGRHASIPDSQDNFRIRSFPAMSTTVNEGFFSNLVVLVEGVTDAVVIWKVQEHLNSNWDQKSISLIPVDSKENIIKPKIVFDGLEIPTYIVFDKDQSGSAINKQLIKLLRITARELGIPSKRVQSTWAYNDLDLEDELKRMLTQNTYEEIWSAVEGELRCHERWIRKKAEPLARFIEIAYEEGHSLPHCEAIVNRVNALYKQRKCPEGL